MSYDRVNSVSRDQAHEELFEASTIHPSVSVIRAAGRTIPMRAALFLSLVTVVSALPAHRAGAQGSHCRAADDDSQTLIQEVRDYATARTGPYQVTRDSLRLVLVTASQVMLVTDDSTCRRANDAYKLAVPSSPSGFSNSVYVVAAGSRYVVLDPQYRYKGPGTGVAVVFDSKWRKLSVF